MAHKDKWYNTNDKAESILRKYEDAHRDMIESLNMLKLAKDSLDRSDEKDPSEWEKAAEIMARALEEYKAGVGNVKSVADDLEFYLEGAPKTAFVMRREEARSWQNALLHISSELIGVRNLGD